MVPFKKILCPTDFSELSYEALEAANQLALYFSAELSVIHVLPPVRFLPVSTATPTSNGSGYQDQSVVLLRRSLDEVITQRTSKELSVHPKVITGDDVAEKIIQTADEQQADLIVIASHGMTGWRRFMLGSVTDKVLKNASCSVLLIQAPHKAR